MLHLSLQDNAKLLQERAVAYINADSAIEGEHEYMRESVFAGNDESQNDNHLGVSWF